MCPAVSRSQQKAAALALAAKRGKVKVSELRGSAKGMYKSMTASQLEDFAATPRNQLPERVTRKSPSGGVRSGRPARLVARRKSNG